jgi:predicted NBD/HSP70 family sugar kinase
MRISLAASQDEVRRHNLATVLRRLHLGGAVSRSELVALTGLNRSTVGALVNELAEQGLVVEEPGASIGVGRPSLVVAVQPRSAVVLAFDFRVDRTVGSVMGLGGEMIERVERARSQSASAPKVAIQQILDMTHELLECVPEETIWVGTGIGVPGIVNAKSGMVSQAPNLGWVDVPFEQLINTSMEEEFGEVPPIFVSNDADLGVLAEHTRGRGVAARNVIYLSGEVGIGGGVILNGELMSGAGGFGGEVGHMVVNPSGTKCRCGSRGCWETVIGRASILNCIPDAEMYGEVQDVLHVVENGDKEVQQRLDSVGRWLGIGLVNLVNIFNPEVIVLGGHLGQIYPAVAGVVSRELDNALRASREQVTVAVASLRDDSTLIGASESAFAPLLNSPLETLSESSTFVAS